MINSSVNWFQRDLDRMDEDSLRRILQQVLVRQPGILFDLMGGGSPTPHPGGEAPSSCVCGRCREMSSDLERLCCYQNFDECLSVRPVSGRKKNVFVF